MGAADARAVSLRPAGGRVAGLSARQAHAGRGAGDRAGRAPARARASRARARSRAFRSRPPFRPSSRPSSTPACFLSAATPTWTGCAGSGTARVTAPGVWCWSRARAGSARPAWRPSSPARCSATVARCATSRAPARRMRWARRLRRPEAHGGRRCWWSTTSIMPARRSGPRSASSGWLRCRFWCSRRRRIRRSRARCGPTRR